MRNFLIDNLFISRFPIGGCKCETHPDWPIVISRLPIGGCKCKTLSDWPSVIFYAFLLEGVNAKLFLIGPFYFMPSHWRA